jgi:hypothetical protein
MKREQSASTKENLELEQNNSFCTQDRRPIRHSTAVSPGPLFRVACQPQSVACSCRCSLRLTTQYCVQYSKITPKFFAVFGAKVPSVSMNEWAGSIWLAVTQPETACS